MAYVNSVSKCRLSKSENTKKEIQSRDCLIATFASVDT